MITIVGIGIGNEEQLTAEASEVLQKAETVYVRSSYDPSLKALPSHIQIRSFDHLYETEHSQIVYERIANELLELAIDGQDIVYAVPGNPFVGEYSVFLIKKRARQLGILTRTVLGISFFELVFELLEFDPFWGLDIVMAEEMVPQAYPTINTDHAVLIVMAIWPITVKEVAVSLRKVYSDGTYVTVIEEVGLPGSRKRTLLLRELEELRDLHPLSCLFIPKQTDGISFASLANSYFTKNERTPANMHSAAALIVEVLRSSEPDKWVSLFEEATAIVNTNADIYPSVREAVRWDVIQLIIGRFIMDPNFRGVWVNNPDLASSDYDLNARERLVLNVLTEWK